jgi:hypothetical protein
MQQTETLCQTERTISLSGTHEPILHHTERHKEFTLDSPRWSQGWGNRSSVRDACLAHRNIISPAQVVNSVVSRVFVTHLALTQRPQTARIWLAGDFPGFGWPAGHKKVSEV